jgi:ubiquinone/menaquinone biosynthesis C-methylase UbiE
MSGKKRPEWFETFFGGLYSRVLAAQFDTARTLAQARLVRRVLGLRKGQKVLDCPCGQGRLTIPLAGMGLRVAGLDLTGSFLRSARQAASKARLSIPFIQGDMRYMDFDAEFDVVVNWYTSIGYSSDADDLAFCRRAFRALKPGGKVLVETMNKSWMLAHFRPRSDRKIAGVRLSNRVRYDAAANRIRDNYSLSRGSMAERHRVSIRLYSGAEMRELLNKAGFRDIRLLGHDWKRLERFTRHSRRLIAVAKRPADS